MPPRRGITRLGIRLVSLALGLCLLGGVLLHLRLADGTIDRRLRRPWRTRAAPPALRPTIQMPFAHHTTHDIPPAAVARSPDSVASRTVATDEPSLGMPSVDELSSLTLAQKPSVTVIARFSTPAALKRTLDSLVKQTEPPDQIVVDASSAVNGGDDARHVVGGYSLGNKISVISVSATQGPRKRTHSRFSSFAYALQAFSAQEHVLVLDPNVCLLPRALAMLARLSSIPAGVALIGLEGWRISDLNDGDSGKVVVDSAVGRTKGAAPRPFEVDVLRGGWWLRRQWVQNLFRDEFRLGWRAGEGRAPTERGGTGGGVVGVGGRGGGVAGLESEPALISSLVRRHGDLVSLVLPGCIDPAVPLPPPSALEDAAWTAQLSADALHGAVQPYWRGGLPPRGQGVRVGAGVGDGVGDGVGEGVGEVVGEPSSVALLFVSSPAAARHLQPLYSAMRAPKSFYRPLLVIAAATPPPVDSPPNAKPPGPSPPLGCTSAACRCEELIPLLNESPTLCAQPSSVRLLDDDGYGLGLIARLSSLLVEIDTLIISSGASVLLVPQADDLALSHAAASAAASHQSLLLLTPPPAELGYLEWVPLLRPSALLRWHELSVHVAIITHRRPRSLRRLLASLNAAHYLGDPISLSISVDAGADAETLALVRQWQWTQGEKSLHARVASGGLVAAVVESWMPKDDKAHGLLLEDDIEVSPYFYVYLKLMLLAHAHGGAAADAAAADAANDAAKAAAALRARLLAISMYTPRLVEVSMPRRKLELYDLLKPRAADAHGGSEEEREHVFVQQLPCSWGSLFFPKPWVRFRRYMRERLAGRLKPVVIPRSATNEWKVSWKKLMIDQMYLESQLVLYPNFFNQSSFSTNHLERGEHVGGKQNTLRHRPIDFTVPLLDTWEHVRRLWTTQNRELTISPLEELTELDLFSRPVQKPKRREGSR